MVLRSRISTIARPPATEPETTPEPQSPTTEAPVRGRITAPVVNRAKETIYESAAAEVFLPGGGEVTDPADREVGSQPELAASYGDEVIEQITDGSTSEAPDPEGYNGVTGSGDYMPPPITFGKNEVEPVAERRPRRGPIPMTPEQKAAKRAAAEAAAKAAQEAAASAIFTPAASVLELRAQLRELEVQIKDVRARHESELQGLRTLHRDLHDRLFDLLK